MVTFYLHILILYYIKDHILRKKQTHPACDVVATSHLGLIQVETSRTMLRRHRDVATGTSMRRTYFRRLSTSHWYVNKTDQFETSQRRTNWYLSQSDQLNTSQRRHNWYLNETDVFETPQRRTTWNLWSSSLISGHFDMSF